MTEELQEAIDDFYRWRTYKEAKEEGLFDTLEIELASEAVLDLAQGKPADPNLIEKALNFLEEFAELNRSRE